MKRTVFTLLIIFLLPFSALAQALTDIDRLGLIPDLPAKPNTYIYLHKSPVWGKVILGKSVDVAWTSPMNDSRHMGAFLFGSHNIKSNSNFFYRQYLPQELKFTEKKRDNKPALLDDFSSTDRSNNYIRFHLKEGSWETFSITSQSFNSKTGTQSIKRSIQELLVMAAGDIQYKLENLRYYQTQDKAHILLDITYTKTTLEADEKLRRWVTIKAQDLSLVHNILVPRSTGINYISLFPIGTQDLKPTEVHGYSFKLANKAFANHESMYITRPGTDVVYAAYSTPYFGRGITAVARVDMKTGNIDFIEPPRDDMKRANGKFVTSGFQKDTAYDYSTPLWVTTNEFRFEDYEIFLHHSEAENTYMTVSTMRSDVEDLQFVMQNSDGEYLERMERHVPLNHFRIRHADTHELLSAYVLLYAKPIRTSWDEKYMVFIEGTTNAKVLTLRDRKTGKLIHKAPFLDDFVSKRQIITESKDGMLIMGLEERELGATFWAY